MEPSKNIYIYIYHLVDFCMIISDCMLSVKQCERLKEFKFVFCIKMFCVYCFINNTATNTYYWYQKEQLVTLSGSLNICFCVSIEKQEKILLQLKLRLIVDILSRMASPHLKINPIKLLFIPGNNFSLKCTLILSLSLLEHSFQTQIQVFYFCLFMP